MYKITNVDTLGEDYTVSDSKGNFLKTIQIIQHSEILDAALGEYTADFGSFSDYLEKSIAVMTGFDDIDPNKILWYATSGEEVVLAEVIGLAVEHGYDIVILEHLDELE